MSASLPLRRLGHVSKTALRHGLAHLLGPSFSRWGWLRRWLPATDLDGPRRFRAFLEEAGGTFIKFGQMLALQPDIIPLAYCDALFKLLDHIEPFPYSEAQRIFREELGREPEEVFASIDPTPLATASVGQVHRAVLDGRQVAVKIRRPAVDRDFAGDIRLMNGAVRAIRGLRFKALDWLVEPLSEFVDWTQEELDFRVEASYCERLFRLTVDSTTQRIPEVFSALTSRRTLVMEFLDGMTLSAYLEALERRESSVPQRLAELGFEPEVFARNIIDNFLGDAFQLGIYHADLHPANLMILPGNVVGYIDFGITGVLSAHARSHLIRMTLGLTRGDLKQLSEEFLEVSVIAPDADLGGFRDKLARLAAPWYQEEDGRRCLRQTITRVMTDMLHLSRREEILPQRDVIKYIRSAIAIDGLIQRFAPGFDVAAYVADAADRALRWQSLRTALTVDHALDWSEAGTRLADQGSARTARLMQRMAQGEMPVVLETRPVAALSEGAARRRRCVELAAFLAAAALLLVADPGEPALALNLFTAEILLLAVGSTLLLTSLKTLIQRKEIP